MERRGEYGGGYRDTTPKQDAPRQEASRQEVPRNISENRQDIAGVNFEEFSPEEWDQAQQLHETRGTVFSTLDSGMKSEASVVDGPNNDPKYWKIMGDSLKSLGVPEDYVQKYMGKMEGLMADAQENGPAVLADQRTYIDTAVAALNESIKYARTRETSLKASGNPTSTAWDSMQLRRRVEQDKFATERVRRGAGRRTTEAAHQATPDASMAETQIINLEDFKRGKQGDIAAEGEPEEEVPDLDFKNLDANIDNPKYWKRISDDISHNPSMKGVKTDIDNFLRRIARGDKKDVLAPLAEKIRTAFQKRAA